MESLAAGATLAGRFRLIRPLGQGAMGQVWLAEDLREGRQVALKFAGEAPAAQELLRSGFQLASKLVHPGIVRVHEFVEESPPFLVMQYVEGANIGVLRGAGCRAVLKALLPVAEALEHAHRLGVVHGDLKASNVLRDGADRCRIADFGSPAGGGSLPGMSPQQLDGEPVTVGDDVYGFGALLYDLLAGQPLFHPEVTPERIRHEIPVIPATDLTGEPLPEGLRLLLRATLQKSRSQRPAGMGAVRGAIEEILA